VTGALFGVLRLAGVVVGLLKIMFSVKSERERELAHIPLPFSYAVSYALHISLFAISLTYSVMLPLILPISLIHFSLWYIVDKYNIICVNPNQPSLGGSLTSSYLGMLFGTVVLYNLTMMGVFGTKESFPLTTGTLILLIVSIFIFRWIKRRFNKSTRVVPLEIVRNGKYHSIGPEDDDLFFATFLQPEFTMEFEDGRTSPPSGKIGNTPDQPQIPLKRRRKKQHVENNS